MNRLVTAVAIGMRRIAGKTQTFTGVYGLPYPTSTHVQPTLNHHHINAQEAIMRLLSLPLPTVLSGLVAVLVGYASSWQAALAAGATAAEIAGWMTALGIAMGISTLTLTLWYRAPVLTARSTPGAALLVTGLQGLSLPDTVGIFIVANALIVLCGVTGLFARLMRIIPHSLAAAMLAGILLRFGLQAFGMLNGEFVMCGGMYSLKYSRLAMPLLLPWSWG